MAARRSAKRRNTLCTLPQEFGEAFSSVPARLVQDMYSAYLELLGIVIRDCQASHGVVSCCSACSGNIPGG